ncbi:ATP synthase subunit I [Kangiella sp.]|uniref:ATP synthase subunit I n=1 Tax=Kangiella sp. TaxID=1920245 RepID=UPI0019A85B27|nr:ATP synthase subunit I [Kangiella sp.]MBD3654219.1 ATP synthase subunit I [Kangiella sp.]
MSESLAKKGRNQAYKMILLQLGISLALVLIGLLFSLQVSMSLGVGSLIVIIAHFIFATIVFRKSGAQAAEAVKKAFKIGESLKILLTIGLLIFAFTVLPVHPPSLLIGYVIIVLSQWFAPLIIKSS